MTNLTQKAVRAIIPVGDIQLDVFQLPDGGYVLSKKQTFESVGIVTRDTPRWLRTNNLEPLSSIRLKYEHNGVGGTIDGVSIPDAIMLWHYVGTTLNNQLALGLVLACAIESIERRADKEFNKQVTEQERNEKLACRMNGILSRKGFTASVNSYIDRHPELSNNAKRFLYSNATDALYRALFNKPASKLKEELGGKPRDCMTAIELHAIDHRETYAMQLIDRHDVYPLDAIKQAVAFFA